MVQTNSLGNDPFIRNIMTDNKIDRAEIGNSEDLSKLLNYFLSANVEVQRDLIAALTPEAKGFFAGELAKELSKPNSVGRGVLENNPVFIYLILELSDDYSGESPRINELMQALGKAQCRTLIDKYVPHQKIPSSYRSLQDFANHLRGQVNDSYNKTFNCREQFARYADPRVNWSE